MSKLGFNQIFAAILVLCLISAFVLPMEYTDPVRGAVQGMFAPVSRPVRLIAGAVRGRFDGPEDLRAPKSITEENQRLRATVTSLMGQIEELQKLAADRRRLRDVGQMCIPVSVIGSDTAGGRDSLALAGTARDGVAVGMAVLHPAGLAGRIERVGVGGSQCRLITDPGMRMTCKFGRYGNDGQGGTTFSTIEADDALLEGMGKNLMMVRNLKYDHVKKVALKVGDTVVLDDREWPAPLMFQRLGQITSITPRRSAPLVADIEVRPQVHLAGLREVLVMTKSSIESDETQTANSD
jgi:cell shape-determining protein MreC